LPEAAGTQPPSINISFVLPSIYDGFWAVPFSITVISLSSDQSIAATALTSV
jgi:hypothetical protein